MASLSYRRMVTSLNRSSYSFSSFQVEIHTNVESYSINQAAQVPASLLNGEQRRRTGVLHSVWAHRVRYGSSTGVSHHSPPAEMPPNPPPSTGTPPCSSYSLPENSVCLSHMWLPAIAGSSCHPLSCQTRSNCTSLNRVCAEAQSRNVVLQAITVPDQSSQEQNIQRVNFCF